MFPPRIDQGYLITFDWRLKWRRIWYILLASYSDDASFSFTRLVSIWCSYSRSVFLSSGHWARTRQPSPPGFCKVITGFPIFLFLSWLSGRKRRMRRPREEVKEAKETRPIQLHPDIRFLDWIARYVHRFSVILCFFTCYTSSLWSSIGAIVWLRYHLMSLFFFLGCCCCWLLSLSSHASSLARKLHSSIRSIFPPDRKPKKRSGGRKGEGRKWDGMGEREMGEREEVDDDDEEDEGEGRGGDEEEAAVKKFRKKNVSNFSLSFFFWRRKKCVLAIWRDFRCFDLSLPLLLLGKRNHSETDE